MSTAPRIALVVPAYHAARHLPALIASVRAQTLPFDQLVLCDDASGDDTAAIARAAGFDVVVHDRNAGCSAAKNTGLAAVRADWVHFHDADDLLDPGYVAAARAAIADDAIDAWLPGWHYDDAATGERIATSALDGTLLRADPVAFHLRHTVNNVGVYRVALLRAIGGFDLAPDVLYNEDRAFHLRLAKAGARFAHDPVPRLTMLRHAGSMSQANQLRCLRAHAAITQRHIAEHGEHHAAACGAALWQAAQGLASHGDFAAAHRLVSQAAALGHRVDPNGNARFRAACRISPHLALRAREYAVRWFRPWLRRGFGP